MVGSLGEPLGSLVARDGMQHWLIKPLLLPVATGRAVAQIAQDQEDVPKSKKQRRKEILEVVEAGEKEDEFEVARRVAASNVARQIEDDESVDDETDDDDDDMKGDGGASSIRGGAYGRGGGVDANVGKNGHGKDEDGGCGQVGGERRHRDNPLLANSLMIKGPSKSERTAAESAEKAW